MKLNAHPPMIGLIHNYSNMGLQHTMTMDARYDIFQNHQ